MKSMSWLGCVAVSASHPTGAPVPSGYATMNPSLSALALNWVVRAWIWPTPPKPWMSTTTGSGAAPGWVGGVVSRYPRVTPSTDTVSFCSVTAGPDRVAVPDDEQPDDGTARPALAEPPAGRGDEQAPATIESPTTRASQPPARARLPYRPSTAQHSSAPLRYPPLSTPAL